jgi:tetratricopeptide (TPR) repeat protein
MSFTGKKVAFAGRFAAVTREEAAELVAEAGGTPVARAGRDTDLVVVGDEPWPVRDDGHLAANLERARALQDDGHAIEILSERGFLERLGVPAGQAEAPLACLYTTQQLGRILKIPVRRLRAWVRRGILKPCRTEHRLEYFDFRQASEVKRLAELTAKGVSVATIRESLELLRRWFPETESALHRLDSLGGASGLLVRLGPGQLAEPSGQLTLLFEDDEPGAPDAEDEVPDPSAAEEAPKPPAEPGPEPATPPAGRPQLVVIPGGAPPGATPPRVVTLPAVPEPSGPAPVLPAAPRSADEWFEIALELEEADHLDEAARAYREALLAGGPSAEIAFNLGNVLYTLGRLEEALSRFEQAVEIDPEYAEAWNNLASVHAQFEEWDDAIEAGRRALELSPEFLDAHYNLAEAYHGAGRGGEARRHARVYLSADPRSPWAHRLRENLGLAS